MYKDVPNIKYRIDKLLSKEQIIKSDSEEELTLIVASEAIKFLPQYQSDLNERVYDAYLLQL